MAVSREILAGTGLVLAGAAIIAVAVAAIFRPEGRKSLAASGPSQAAAAGPKAVVDHATYDRGIIELAADLEHTFVIRNEGQTPLRLTPGPSECACTVAELPRELLPPGGEAKVKLSISEAAKNDELKAGPCARDIHVFTNDPHCRDLVLKVTATVSRRVTVAPSRVTLSLDSSKPLSPQERSFEAWVYSERWEQFDLSVAKLSRAQIECRIEPAAAAKLKERQACCGYRVAVTLPPDMAEGRFAESIEFAARENKGDCPDFRAPTRSGGPKMGLSPSSSEVPGATTCRLEIGGRVNGRLTFYSPKIADHNVLQLGTRPRGERIRETLIVKLSDERRRLRVQQIETEPAFLHARLVPYAGGPNGAGLYRLEVEIPGDAPACAWTGPHRGQVRLRTDHPRLRTIELQVDFVLTTEGEAAAPVAAR
jgi:hypothetical protein